MKVKKIANRSQCHLNVVKPTIHEKSNHFEHRVNGFQTNHTISVSTTNPNSNLLNDEMGLHLPQLNTIPQFNSCQHNTIDSPLPQMPELKELPLFICVNNENIAINSSINTCNNDKESQLNDSNTSLLDKMANIDEESIDAIIQDLNIQSLTTNDKTFAVNNTNDYVINNNLLSENSIATITPLSTSYENNNSLNLTQNETTVINITEKVINQSNQTKPLNTIVNKVIIDLSDDTNSPQNSSVTQFMPSNNSINTFQSIKFPTNHNFPQSSVSLQMMANNNTQQLGSQTNVMLKKKKKIRSQKKCVPIKPFKYCARNYRVIGVTRHSSRLKTNNNEMCGHNPYDYIENASFSEIDGSKYNCNVSKWREDNNEMSEDKRKAILSNVNQMKFRKSVFKEDEGVFYSFSAFKEECSPTNGLKCMMRLDSNAIKHMRFNGEFITKLFLLSGQSLLNAENGKQRKTIETGHEVLIPEHTRYQLENKNIESCYFLVHMFKPNMYLS